MKRTETNVSLTLRSETNKIDVLKDEVTSL